MGKKLAIIGASYLQEPLINKAKNMGFETHVFAWKCGDIGEEIADYFYPISIVEIDEITKKCKEIGIDGICTIASDLASITVNKVANALGLVSNSLECTEISTNKHMMRLAFEKNGDPSPKSIMVDMNTDLNSLEISFPAIVKPTDRSGSRGITKVQKISELKEAIKKSTDESFEKKALVEEFAEGIEYSVECISWNGKHTLLAITRKYTTGYPNFIETGHIQPSGLDDNMQEKVKNIVYHALDSLKVKVGASHSEIKIDSYGNIKIIEIGARMGGDFIGSDLVFYSTGNDFVKMVIECSLGIEPTIIPKVTNNNVGVRFIFNQNDLDVYKSLKKENPELVVYENINENISEKVTDSSNRNGAFIITSDNRDDIIKYMPENEEE